MKDHEKHSNKEAWDVQQKALFEQLETPFEQNTENAWESLLEKTYETPKENKIEEAPRSTKIISSIWFRMAAASIFLATSTLIFAKFYTTNINCLRGEHLAHSLPDGSTIQLNAESSIRYAPYWWSITRSLQLEGEAFFEVKKGSRFTVKSKLGTTEVLGTSFNIYARKDQYRVLCTTGKVKVTTQQSKHSITLIPNELAVLVNLKQLEKNKTTEVTNIVAWKRNMFYFNIVPLPDVFDEIERQYDIKIDYHPTSDSLNQFIGSFEKQYDTEQVLQMLTLPFGFKFKKIKKDYYVIETQ
jgi:ferric-dicitrate binding protein FerR (iron transport regulator)